MDSMQEHIPSVSVTSPNTLGTAVPLNEDVLWRTFTLFTIPDEDFESEHNWPCGMEKTLVNLRHFSHVCSLWRRILLSSSSIWANALNFRHLEQASDRWRQEILLRTGAAPLSVIYPEISLNSPAKSFFLSMVRDNWWRMRRICFCTRILRNFKDDERWTSFARPAPKLEICNISFSFLAPSPFLSIAQDRFPNTLPFIKTIIIENATFFLCQSMTRLRSLTLISCVINEDLFTTLSELPSLERIRIAFPRVRSQLALGQIMAEDTRRRIYMPSLKELEIVPQSFEAIFWSLHRLAPSPRRTCVLDFRHGVAQPTISSLQIQHCLAQHVQSLFSSPNSGSIIFGIHTILLKRDVNNVSDPSSSPHLHVKLQSASSLIMEIVIESINQCDLSSLTHIQFDFYPEPNASCIKLITQTLFNATHVTITPMTLKSIMKLYDRNFPAGVMFPSLQVLTFDTLEAAFDIDTSTLQQFLDSRPDMPRIQVRKVGNTRLPSGELVAFNLERADEDHLVWV